MKFKKILAIALCVLCHCHAEEANFHVLSWSPRIFLIEKFLTDEECNHLIELARPHLERTTIVSPDTYEMVIDEARTSMGIFLPRNSSDLVTRRIEKRIAEWTLLPEENGEGIQVLQYAEGGEYRPHYDFFNPERPGEAHCIENGGQRVATVIMYLNDVPEGGETVFPYAEIAIMPVKGNALLFFNCTPDGEEDFTTLHAGVPVLRGEKWIATKWIRTES